MNYPWMKFFVSDWRTDPKVSLCSPATRGIWMDLLCAMHELDRSGVITGTPETLARVGRCSAVELAQAVAELQTHGVADVTERCGIVTLVNRRMSREAKIRNGSKLRMQRMRCDAPVTRQKSEVRVQSTEKRERQVPGPHVENDGLARAPFSERPDWKEFWSYCQQVGLDAEWYARDKFLAAEADAWRNRDNWKAYVSRCRAWWEADGRPMTPPKKARNGDVSRESAALREIKSMKL